MLVASTSVDRALDWPSAASSVAPLIEQGVHDDVAGVVVAVGLEGEDTTLENLEVGAGVEGGAGLADLLERDGGRFADLTRA
jgi:hypothetical protein